MNREVPSHARYRIAPLAPRGESRIKRGLTWLARMLRFARREMTSPIRLPLARRWGAWRRGFSTRSYVIYGLDAHDPRHYLSDYASIARADRVNGPFNAVVGNKLAFARAMALYGLRHPRVHAVLDRGVVHSLDAPGPGSSVRSWLADGLTAGRRVVCKPAAAGSGQGIIFVTRVPTGVLVNDVPASLDDADVLLAPLRRYLITEFAEQADYAARIYPGTTNTVRILTLWDMDLGAPFAAAAVHRFGTVRSAPVDNWHGGWGGLSAGIGVDTGTLGPGATLSDRSRLVWHERHPESGAPIAGVRVEGWPSTVEMVLAAAARFPEAPAIGWDLVITRDGCSFLEGNCPPGVYVWQVHAPLLADPRVRRFYREHGVI